VKILSACCVASAAEPDAFPRDDVPEVAFLGRSNVGKSSLLNRLVGRRQLARTSATPGKTRCIHFYRIERKGGPLLLVDLPGYGWARVSESERRRWRWLVERYLGERRFLRGAILLQDLRRDVSLDEHRLLAWLAEREIPTFVALTKIDKLKPMRRAQRLQQIAGHFGVHAERVVATSARSGTGIDGLWRGIERLLH
jgi:GTP-binding protein